MSDTGEIASDRVTRMVTTVACTLIAAFAAWTANAAYQTTLTVAEMKRDLSYLDGAVKELKERVKDIGKK